MANGGIIGPCIASTLSFGKNTVTSKTSDGTVTTQPGTTLVDFLVVAGGGGGGSGSAGPGGGGGGGGAGGFRTFSSVSVCGATPYPATVGGGGAGAPGPSNCNAAVGENSAITIGSTTYTSSGGGLGGR